MEDCVFCGKSVTGGWRPPFGKAGICGTCMRSMEEYLANGDKLGVKDLKQDVGDIKRDLRRL